MQLKDIIGQEGIKQKLVALVHEDRLPHALMLVGPAGTGKRSLAVATAQLLACQDRQPTDSCGACPSCVKFAKLVHPDLHFVIPVSTTSRVVSKPKTEDFLEVWREVFLDNPYLSENQWYEAMGAENKQGLINVAESHSVSERLSLKPYESDYRMMLIWLPERMNREAANKLLKLIEEPPPLTHFFLVSEKTDRILPTILSRTQILPVPPLEEGQIREGLLPLAGHEDELLEDAVRRANGNFNTALVTLQKDEQELQFFELFTQLMRLAYGRKIIELNDWVDQVASLGREKQKRLIDYALRLLRENFMLNLAQEQLSYMSAREREFSQRFSAFIHPGNVFELSEEFTLAGNHIEANGNPKIVLMDLSIKVIRLLMKKPAA